MTTKKRFQWLSPFVVLKQFSRIILLLALSFGFFVNASASKSLDLDDYFIVGQSNYRFLLWNVYDATLKAKKQDYEPGQGNLNWQQTKNISLTLDYDINADAVKVVDRTIEEMQALGFYQEVKLKQWHALMMDIFPDIQKSDQLTANYLANGDTDFYKNNQYLGTISDSEFGLWFFSIWLDENASRDRDFSRELLGFDN